MRKVTDDRRTRKTRTAIETAFMELIQKNDINKITIQAIADKADTNRSTFYTHYEDIYDLLHSIEEKLIKGISLFREDNILKGDSHGSMVESLEYVENNKSLFAAILNSSQGPEFRNGLVEVFSKKLLAVLDNVPNNKMLVCLYTNGAIAVIQEWIMRDDKTMSANELCKFLESAVRDGLGKSVRRNG